MYFILNGKTTELHQYVKFLLRRDTLLSYGEKLMNYMMINQYQRSNANNLPG